MIVYDFSLACGYEVTGVDTAMCVRAGILQELGYKVKLIFPTPPSRRDLMLYVSKGISYSQMLGVHSYFSDIHDYKPVSDLQRTLKWLKEVLDYSEKQYLEDSITLTKDGRALASMLLTEDKQGFYGILYYKDARLIRMDLYSDCMYASIFYETKKTDRGYEAVAKERCFYNRDGSIALTQIFQRDTEINILPDGSSYNQAQLFGRFIQRLDLTKEDMVILDRPITLFPAKFLLACHDKTNIIAVFHSEHFFIEGLSTQGKNLGMEYWYWCKYSNYIHTMIVSTNEQKSVLEETLNTYGFAIPEIKVIPVVCLDQIRRPEIERKRKSIVCVSRLDRRKKIDWTIYTAIKAHEMDNEITLDIYGTGHKEYIQYLEELINTHHASDYIKLKGRRNVTDIYKQYEVYLTTSLWETFGITLLEAVGSGLAMIGLDVRYGNRLFIENGQNGYLVPYDPEHFYQECPSEIDILAKHIVEMVSDKETCERFSEKSYEIARRYLPEQIKEKWKDLLSCHRDFERI